jgi:AraC-like DNA-binding protein
VPAASRAPHPTLRGHVRRYYGFREDAPRPVRRQEGPGADVVLVLSFGEEWLVDGVRHTSFVGGLHDRQVETEHGGRSHGLQVDVSPPAAYGLLGVPQHLLAGRTIAFEDLLGREAEALVERLVDAAGWQERFDLLDVAFAQRLADARPPSPGVVWAYERLRETHGRVRIGELARELGWSRKRLAERFREQVGLPPKTVARMLRFERAAALAEEGERGWAEIAFACGYYDQSHLVNEFRAIAGRTPTEFARDTTETVTFFQDGPLAVP